MSFRVKKGGGKTSTTYTRENPSKTHYNCCQCWWSVFGNHTNSKLHTWISCWGQIPLGVTKLNSNLFKPVWMASQSSRPRLGEATNLCTSLLSRSLSRFMRLSDAVFPKLDNGNLTKQCIHLGHCNSAWIKWRRNTFKWLVPQTLYKKL